MSDKPDTFISSQLLTGFRNELHELLGTAWADSVRQGFDQHRVEHAIVSSALSVIGQPRPGGRRRKPGNRIKPNYAHEILFGLTSEDNFCRRWCGFFQRKTIMTQAETYLRSMLVMCLSWRFTRIHWILIGCGALLSLHRATTFKRLSET